MRLTALRAQEDSIAEYANILTVKPRCSEPVMFNENELYTPSKPIFNLIWSSRTAFGSAVEISKKQKVPRILYGES